jgi:hypothetical protein
VSIKWWEGAVKVKSRKIKPDHLPKLCQRILGLDQIVEIFLQAIGLGLRAADEWADAREDLDPVRAAAESACLPLDICIKLLGAGERLMRREDDFGELSGEGAPVLG